MQSDFEVICEFMEPKPTVGPVNISDRTDWWGAAWRYCPEPFLYWASPFWWIDSVEILERLRRVEDRLSDAQFRQYADRLCDSDSLKAMRERNQIDYVAMRALVQTSAKQKIRALAAVLSPEAGQ